MAAYATSERCESIKEARKEFDSVHNDVHLWMQGSMFESKWKREKKPTHNENLETERKTFDCWMFDFN